MLRAKKQNNKNKAVKFSFNDRSSRWRRATIFTSQWNSRVLFLLHTSVKSMNLFNFLTRNVFLFLRLKTYSKHLIGLEFSVRTVSYGSSFFPARFMANHEASSAVRRPLIPFIVYISGEFSVALILTTSFCNYLSLEDGLIPSCIPQTTDFLAKLFAFGKGES